MSPSNEQPPTPFLILYVAVSLCTNFAPRLHQGLPETLVAPKREFEHCLLHFPSLISGRLRVKDFRDSLFNCLQQRLAMLEVFFHFPGRV